MENQSHIPENYNYTTKHLEQKERTLKLIKDNLNYIYIVIMIIIDIILSLLIIKDGKLGVNYPTTPLAWVFWCTRIFLQTFVGVMILNSFRKQGLKQGHEAIKDVYSTYLSTMLQRGPKRPPRSKKEYITKNITKDTLTKSVIFIISGIAVDSLLIGFNLNNLLSLVTNILFALAFGIKDMIDAEDFVVSELVLWYQLKIEEVTDHKLEPSKGENKCSTIQELTTENETCLDKSNSIEERM